MAKLPEELVELIFDKLLEQYPPDLETTKSLFTRDGQKALSALTMVSLVAARRTRTHRFKCVVLVCHPKATKFFKLLANFLELSFSSRQRNMGRLLPISTITTHIKMIGASCAYWNPPSTEFPNHDKTMAFILRLRNEFRLEQLSWFFDPMFKISTGFHQRLVGLLLSPTMKTLCLHSLISYPMQLQGVYIPGPSFDRTFRFGEEDGVDPQANPADIYPLYTKLELGGCHSSGLPLPFDIVLANSSIYRPFSRVKTFRAFDKLPYSVVQSVLENNDGGLRALHIEGTFDLPTWGENVTDSSTDRSRPFLPINFYKLPHLSEVRIEYLIRRRIEEYRLMQIRRLILDAVAKLFDLASQHIADHPIPLKTLDLGTIPMQLSPEAPYPTHPQYATALDIYCNLLEQAPMPSDTPIWAILDAALCTRRFANLETLKIDYLFFDSRGDQNDPPECYEETVKQLVAPSDWLSITKKFFPRTCSEEKIRLEGRVIANKPWSHFHDVDYSMGTCMGRYP